MSGLAAIFHRDGKPVDEPLARRMIEAVPYRGPDGLSLLVHGDVALGFAKMAVTAEDVPATQPLVSPRTGCAVIADVRLDNRAELLALLPLPLPTTVSDAEILLHAYEAWGLDCLPRLLGDFALVIWDPRQQRLVCARDTYGQRTLYYRLDERTFAAASEIRQLFQDPSVPIEPNEERIRHSLVPLEIVKNPRDSHQTYYAGVYAVPAAHVLVVERNEARLRRYWDLTPSGEIRYRSEDEYAEHYLGLFTEVVRARLRSVYPIGLLLSGGLDSSSIVAVAQLLFRSRQVQNPGFVTFSQVFDGLDCDERPLIEEIRAMYDLDARFLPFSGSNDYLQPEPTGFQEMPGVGNRPVRDALLAAVAASGARVVLDGAVADSCVYGTRYVFDSLLRQGRLRELGLHLQAYRRAVDESLVAVLARYCLLPLLPLPLHRGLREIDFRRRFDRVRPRLMPAWLAPALREDLARRHFDLWIKANRERRFSSPGRESEFRTLYPPEMASSLAPWPLEMARPFADRRLHEFLLAIPPELKFSPVPGTDDFYPGSKRLVRRAMCGLLPEAVRTRASKTIFGAAGASELETRWCAYEAAFGPGARPEVALRGYVEQERFWRRLQEARAQGWTDDFLYLKAMAQLETWLRSLRLPRERLVGVPPTASEPTRREEVSLSRS